MTTDPIETGLRQAWARLLSLRPAIDAGSPWPLSERFDHAPEATWGPPEVLAHLVEMLPYWHRELQRLVDSPQGPPPPFGRIATDADRLANIERLRRASIDDLFRSLDDELKSFLATWAGWSEADRQRRGVHEIRGEQTVEAEAQRVLAGHMGDHAEQLALALGPPADR